MGVKSILKKVAEKKIVILKSDKSGKLCVASMDEYMRMGKVHTILDRRWLRLRSI